MWWDSANQRCACVGNVFKLFLKVLEILKYHMKYQVQCMEVFTVVPSRILPWENKIVLQGNTLLFKQCTKLIASKMH